MSEVQSFAFQAEVSRLLHWVVHSLYSNRDIFLRELISNASDALDKLRFQALEHAELYESQSALRIRVSFDAEAKTLTVTDTGIGMAPSEIGTLLGTIAHSGTQAFLDRLGSANSDVSQIGQFGVGFYAAFMVADRVDVYSRKAGDPIEQGVKWSSDGAGTYTLENVVRPERGTEIVLHLKENSVEYADRFKLQQIILKYSDHIAFPIELQEAAPVSSSDQDTEDAEDVSQKTPTFTQINRATALWLRSKSDIQDSEYQEFYKNISHDGSDPLAWSHNRVEGRKEYISLLYIPRHAPFDLWNREKPHGLKLYVQRVYIMDQADAFLPLYLRFVQGVLDASDLPLNVSREILQSHATVESLRESLTQRVLSMLEHMASEKPEDYKLFWKEFGDVMKEGIIEDFAHRNKLLDLLRATTLRGFEEHECVSLNDYVSRMPSGQEKIYYMITGQESKGRMSPQLEIFKKQGIEVLLLDHRIDEWWIAHVHEYQGKKLESVGAADLTAPCFEGASSSSEDEAIPESWQKVFAEIKNYLGDRVKEVKRSKRLVEAPCCLIEASDEASIQRQRFMKAMGQNVSRFSDPTLEINTDHALLQKIQKDGMSEDYALFLYEQALLAEGESLSDPAAFIQRMNQLLVGNS